jgi:aryl-alcohol dehydrogenase-like predicted oxidoreductase
MNFGEDWASGCLWGEAWQIYDALPEAGGNFTDTANIHTNGTSETSVLSRGPLDSGEFKQV